MEFPSSIAQSLGLRDADSPGEMWINVLWLEATSLTPHPCLFPFVLRDISILFSSKAHSLSRLQSSSQASH